jgi:hypothetical protein
MGYREEGYVGYAKVFMCNDRPDLDNELYVKPLYNDHDPESAAGAAGGWYYIKSYLVKDIEPVCVPPEEKIDVSKLETGTVLRIRDRVTEKIGLGTWQSVGHVRTDTEMFIQAIVDGSPKYTVRVLFDPRAGDADLTGQIF